MIQFTHVSKTYKENWKALDDVTLQIRSGEFVFLLGHSGAGKTTLLKHIYMEERPDLKKGGQVLVSFGRNHVYDSKNSGASSVQLYRRRLGIVFQDFKLLEDRDVFENVAFAMRVTGKKSSEIKQRVYEVLAWTGISHLRNSLPHTLSGGEKQRCAIARAIVNDPPIIIADEPTGNLDPQNALEIFELFREINNRGATVVMATHNPRLYENSSYRRLSLNKGRLMNKEMI
jgi:cell division transport system ATP-binding protein